MYVWIQMLKKAFRNVAEFTEIHMWAKYLIPTDFHSGDSRHLWHLNIMSFVHGLIPFEVCGSIKGTNHSLDKQQHWYKGLK